MSEKKMVRRSVALALGIICILLIAFIAYFSITGISAQNSYNNLQNQNKQLQTWLNGNETDYRNQLNNLTAIVNMTEFTYWANGLSFGNNIGSISTVRWVEYAHANYSGYVSIVATSSTAFNMSVELSYNFSNGISYDKTAYIGVESVPNSSDSAIPVYQDSAWFPILPSFVTVTINNLSQSYTFISVSVTYFY